MALTNPLGKIQAVAVRSLKVPVAVVGSAVGLAQGAASAATSLLAGPKAPDAPARAAEPVQASAPKEDSSAHPEPVNVTEELGLDPAPVEKPKVAKKAPKRRPVTKIDAAADPSTVDATPADVADAVAKAGPVGRTSVK